jgi:spermidine synthase
MSNDASRSGDLSPGVLTEYMTDAWGVFVHSKARLEAFRSAYQDVEVHDSDAFGKLFRLDGHFMTSEKDEFYYHENLIHIAALAHPAPANALVVGGGDGGSAEELLKYPTMQRVTLAEIDATVLDLTDPGGPSTALYTPDFYAACAAHLTRQGAMTMHIASPVAHADRIRATLGDLRKVFARVTPYLTSVPLYGGLWMMACCSQTLDPRAQSADAIDARIAERGLARLQYINGETYRAALALPNFVRDIVV